MCSAFFQDASLMTVIHHALALNLHQPHGNLEHLLREKPWEAREILYAYDRIARFLWPYEDVAKVHLSLSGSLLETLSDPHFQQNVYGIVDCGSLLWHLQNQRIIDVLGTAYFHPVLPLIPESDWDDQLRHWRGIAEHLLWRKDFAGFWPPEMGFSMAMIPHLKRFGYRYVVVDSEHVEALTPMSEFDLRYRPHVAKFGEDEITVVVRDREISDAQGSGMDYVWFMQEIRKRTQGCTAPPLVTTCSDGENGAWFRNTNNASNFWGGFYGALLEDAKQGGPVQPIYVHDYLDQFGTFGEVTVKMGAWNTEWHDGKDFTQWTGSAPQTQTLSRLQRVSQEVHQALKEAPGRELALEEKKVLEQAHWRLLRAETSCNFYWGEEWVSRANRDLDAAETTLRRFKAKKYSADADPGWHVPNLSKV